MDGNCGGDRSEVVSQRIVSEKLPVPENRGGLRFPDYVSYFFETLWLPSMIVYILVGFQPKADIRNQRLQHAPMFQIGPERLDYFADGSELFARPS